MSYYQGTQQDIVKYTKTITTNGNHKLQLVNPTSYYTYRLVRATVLLNGCTADSAIVVDYDSPFNNSYDDYDRLCESISMSGTYNVTSNYSNSYNFEKDSASTDSNVATWIYDGNTSNGLIATHQGTLEFAANVSGIGSSSDYLYMEAWVLRHKHNDYNTYTTTWN